MSSRRAVKDDLNTQSNDKKEEILNIIEREFDLELLLKYREMRILEHEIERGKELKELLEKLILNEQIYADKSSGRLSAPPQLNFVPSSSSVDIFDRDSTSYTGDNEIYGTTRTRGGGLTRQTQALSAVKPVSSAQQYQYDIRSDGTVLRMRCPTCGAEKFRSMLGFLNHCRIHCKLVFANQEDRLQRCGVIIPPEEIPLEFQNISHSLIQKSMELAQICADVLPTKVVEDSKPEIHSMEEEPIVLSDFGISDSNFTAPVLNHGTDLTESNNRHTKTINDKERSRFYIKKEIIIGNVSRCLLSTGEVDDSVGGRPATHYFKIFIRDINFRKRRHPDPSGNSRDDDTGILKHIKFARFFLHPAYKPNDVIDVYEHPFTIEKPAWGEFPIRIQLHFFDERNKPVDLVHLLSIYSSTSARYDQGVERLHEIEIDRNTDFSLSIESAERSQYPSEILDSGSDESDSESISLTQSSGVSKNDTIMSSKDVSISIDPESLKYCRYCGIPHMPQHSFDIIQKNCAHKPRKIRLNSRTLPSEVFSNCTIHDQEFHFIPAAVDIDEIPIEDEIIVGPESTDIVKMVASCVKILDLSHFLPLERTSFTVASATKCFLRSLLMKSIEQIPSPSNRAALDQKSPSALTPLHIFQAITGAPIQVSNATIESNRLDTVNNFDFLSNAYFSASNGPAKPQ